MPSSGAALSYSVCYIQLFIYLVCHPVCQAKQFKDAQLAIILLFLV